MRKCPLCTAGSWVVGLAAVAWGCVGAFNLHPEPTAITRAAFVAVGLTGLGFLAFQAPFRPCKRCLATSKEA